MLSKLLKWLTPPQQVQKPQPMAQEHKLQLSYQEKTRQTLQAQLDNPPPQGLKLLPQEYAGPFFIKKPILIDGQGATLWALTGPVVHIMTTQVTLKNLNIEVTGEQFTQEIQACALCIQRPQQIQFYNVQVRGQMSGLPEETGRWHYPYSLPLGQLAAEQPHEFSIQMEIPTPCTLASAIAGVRLSPHYLKPGLHTVQLHIEPLVAGTTLYGNLYLKTTQLKRCIQLSAYIIAKTVSVPSKPTPVLPSTPMAKRVEDSVFFNEFKKTPSVHRQAPKVPQAEPYDPKQDNVFFKQAQKKK